MQTYKCKCGNLVGFGSMDPYPCQACEDCGTVPAWRGLEPRAPIPHDWVTRYNETTGQPYEVCRCCWTRRVGGAA